MQNIKLQEIINKKYFQSTDIADGFSLVKSDFDFKKPHEILSSQNEKKIVVTISLEGIATFNNYDGKKINFKKGYTTITSFDKTDGFTKCDSTKLRQIRLVLKSSFLEKNFSKDLLEKSGYFKQNSLNLVDFSPLHIDSFFIIKQILEYKKQNDLEQLYMQGKALELLWTELNKSKQKVILDSYEKEALMRAKEILLEDIKASHSISKLAKKVHLSEVKLKIGFKDFFGQSPYNFLKSHRLKKAKSLLLCGEYNINEVAQIVGYKFANNFSNAFTKEFGINPKEVLKSVKYY